MCEARPHCRTPDACVSKGSGHCRPCTGAMRMAELQADPARVAARLAKAEVGKACPKYRAQCRTRMNRLHRNSKTHAKMVAAGSANAALNFLSPESRAKCSASRRVNAAKETAARWQIPLSLVDEFRALRHRRFPSDEIIAVLRTSHPAAFAQMEAEKVATALRDLGPAPAIGMPDRAAWTQRANAIRMGVSQ